MLSRRHFQRALIIVTTNSFLLMAGCQRSSPTAVYPVTGKVVVNGKAAPGVQVAFIPLARPVDIDVNPTATTDTEGAFQLTTRAKDDGAPAGEYKVLLNWTIQDGPAEDPRLRKMLPDQYANPVTSPLKTAVQPGTNQLPTFVIKGRK